MRILKYFLLLLVLSTLSLAVFILTQSGQFSVKKSFTLDAPQTVIYEYIHNIDNWNDWIPTTKLAHSTYSIDIDNIGTYTIQEEYSHPYDSLSQDILKDHKISNIIWTLTPNGKKTNVTLSFESNLDLQTKVITFFKGSPNSVASAALEKNVNALIVYFIKQYKNYEIDTSGITTVSDTKYIYLSSTAKLADFELRIPELDKQLRNFCNSNSITIEGDPFLILKNKLEADDIAFDFAIPIKENIFLNEDEVFKLGKKEKDTYFATTFNGHYTHFQQGFTEISHAIERGEAILVKGKEVLLRLEKSIVDSKKPAEWTTVFYIPVTVPKDETPVVNTTATQYRRETNVVTPPIAEVSAEQPIEE